MAHPSNNGDNAPNFDLLDPEDVGAKASTATTSTETTPEEMAGWMGLEPESNSNARASSLSDAEADENEAADSRAGEDGKTKTPLWSNPVMKLAFVAVVAGGCLTIVGLVVNTIQTAGRRDLATPPTARRVEEEPPEDPMQSALRSQGEQIGELKTQNALGNQQLAMQMQEESGAAANSEVSAAELLALRNQIQRRQEEQAQSAPATPPSTPNRAVPRPSTAVSPRPVSRPAPTASAPASSPRPVPPPSPALSPQEQLANLAGIGSYGSGSALPANAIATAPISAPTDAGEIASPQAEMPPTVPSFSNDDSLASVNEESATSAAIPAFQPEPKQVDSTYAAEEAAILGHTLTTVQAGTYAQATLETPIYWAQDLANEQESQRTALKLSEPLYGSRGEVALEAGTLLVAEVNVVAGSGLLQLHVTDVVITQDGQQQVMSIPHQNLVITGNEGQPLVAREIQNTGEIRAAEMQLAALGALGNVGELLNRPNSSTTVIGGDTSVSTVENGAVNLLAGLLEGAADAVLPIEQARVENRIDDYESQPRIWHHDSNEPVMLFVAEEFTFQAD